MAMANAQKAVELSNKERLEFYRLIGEGFKDIQDGRTSTISEVREKLEKARETRGYSNIRGISRA